MKRITILIFILSNAAVIYAQPKILEIPWTIVPGENWPKESWAGENWPASTEHQVELSEQTTKEQAKTEQNIIVNIIKKSEKPRYKKHHYLSHKNRHSQKPLKNAVSTQPKKRHTRYQPLSSNIKH